MLNIFKKSQQKKDSKFEPIKKNELNNILGGAMGEPIPGVVISLEQSPGSVVLSQNTGGAIGSIPIVGGKGK